MWYIWRINGTWNFADTQPTASMPMPTPGPTGQSAQSSLPPSYSAPQHNFVPPAPQDIRVLHQHVGFSLGPNPEKMTCPTCRANIKTTTVSDHQPSAHICCIILCILGWVIIYLSIRSRYRASCVINNARSADDVLIRCFEFLFSSLRHANVYRF